jgi:hypothetical protein
MTGTLRVNRIASAVVLALAVAASVAGVRLASVVAPSFPFLDRPFGPMAPEGAAPAQAPVRDVDPGAQPASGPAINSMPLVGPEAPANAPAGEITGPGAQLETSTPSESDATANNYRVGPSRFSDAEQTSTPQRLAPTQLFPKQPRPGSGS